MQKKGERRITTTNGIKFRQQPPIVGVAGKHAAIICGPMQPRARKGYADWTLALLIAPRFVIDWVNMESDPLILACKQRSLTGSVGEAMSYQQADDGQVSEVSLMQLLVGFFLRICTI